MTYPPRRRDLPARRRETTRRPVDVAVPAVLVAVAILPMWPAYATARFAIAVLLAVALGAAVGTVGARQRWSSVPMAGATLAGLVLASGVAAPRLALLGLIPTPATVGATAIGVVTSWKQALTVAAPLGDVEPLLTVPVMVGLIGALLATSFALRFRQAGWALVPPAAALVTAILFGTVEPLLPIPLGLVGAGVGLAWAMWRAGRVDQRRPLALAVMALAFAVGGLTGAWWGPTEHRVVLREVVEPPLDIRAYPSPLAAFRAYLKDHRDDVLFRVDNLPPGVSIRLAAMDAYDGTAWMVSSGTSPAGGEFRRVGHRVTPTRPEGTIEVTVEVGEYHNVWLPVVSEVVDVEFDGPRAAEHDRHFYFNHALQTGILTRGLQPGDSLTLHAFPPPVPSDSALRGAPTAAMRQADLTGVPDTVAAAAEEFIADAASPAARAQALVGGLIEGYFSHGLEGEVPSVAGHGAARLAEMFTAEVMIGDEEQYAAAMGLMARAVGLPSRVVLGFTPPDNPGSTTAEITGDDITAWVEIAFADHGWVPFYPTPDEDRIPQVEEPDPKDRPQPQVLQPPPPAPEAPEPPPTDRDEVSAEEDEPQEEQALSSAVIIALITGGSVLVLLLPPAGIVALKLWRRRRRRRRGEPARRVAAAWREVTDQLHDLAIPAPPTATRSEQAHQMVTALQSTTTAHNVGLVALANRTDAVVFGPHPPAEEHAHEHWHHARLTTTALRAAVGRRRWLRSRISTRSLRKAR